MSTVLSPTNLTEHIVYHRGKLYSQVTSSHVDGVNKKEISARQYRSKSDFLLKNGVATPTECSAKANEKKCEKDVHLLIGLEHRISS